MKYYDYGDIIIYTSSVKVTIPCVQYSYEWVCEILDYLVAHKDEKNVYIDLNELRFYINNNEEEFMEFDNNHHDWIVEKL